METLLTLIYWIIGIFVAGIFILKVTGEMISGGFKISKNYAFDYLLFHQYRWFEDGITFLDFECKFDKYECDHNPKFTLGLWVLNHTIFEFEVYNVNHLEEDKDVVQNWNMEGSSFEDEELKLKN